MANARATRLLSVRESNLIGTRLHDHVPDTDSHALEEAIRIAAKSANPEEQQLSVSLGPTASALTLRSNAANGRCSGFLVIID